MYSLTHTEQLMCPSPLCYLCVSGVVVESEASSSDHHAALTSPGPSGGEDLHRQVGND